MARKNLAIKEDVYRKLSEVKKEGESFSDVIEKLLERGGDLLPLWGVLSASKRWAEIVDGAREIRKRTVMRLRWYSTPHRSSTSSAEGRRRGRLSNGAQRDRNRIAATTVNALDVLISGIAVANGADTIVTSDRDFHTIPK